MIDIALLSGYNRDMVYELVLKENTTNYEIYVPKSTQLYFSESSSIAQDYAKAAFSGQQLADIAELFAYEQVPPQLHESILFSVTTSKIDELVDALLQISYVYVNDHPEDDLFIEEIYKFLDDVKNSKFQPACPYFIEIYNEISSEEPEESEE